MQMLSFFNRKTIEIIQLTIRSIRPNLKSHIISIANFFVQHKNTLRFGRMFFEAGAAQQSTCRHACTVVDKKTRMAWLSRDSRIDMKAARTYFCKVLSFKAAMVQRPATQKTHTAGQVKQVALVVVYVVYLLSPGLKMPSNHLDEGEKAFRHMT